MVQHILESEPLASVQVCQLDLGQSVLDPASLDIFWAEITGGAYGTIDRVEGLFNLADGRGFQFCFVAGEVLSSPDDQYTEIEDEHCLTGRPDRPSSLSVIGQNLDSAAIQETLAACSLNDQILDHYQSQLRSQL